MANTEIVVNIPKAHQKQQAFIESKAKFKVIRAGRRGGKTVGVSILAIRAFLAGRRVLYATPTQDQIDRFWHEIKLALDDPLKRGIFYKNETRHIIELEGTEQRLRAKTAWNADSLRGDYADLLIFDEWQLMNEDAWDRVGAPMLMDNDGDAVFIYTPPTLDSRSASKAIDPRHAAKLFKRAERDTTGEWETFHFSSYDNPHISKSAINRMSDTMSNAAFRMEIEAQDIDEVPGALWSIASLNDSRVSFVPAFHRVIVGVDPQASTGQTGIVVVGFSYVKNVLHGFTLADRTTPGGVKPAVWAQAAVDAYHDFSADLLVGEVNNGGDMIEAVIRSAEGGKAVNYETVTASRGKYTRAEPIAALFVTDEARGKRARCHMHGEFPYLEDELISWVPGNDSPNRLDAMVWAYTKGIYGNAYQNFKIERNSVSLYGSRTEQGRRNYRQKSVGSRIRR